MKTRYIPLAMALLFLLGNVVSAQVVEKTLEEEFAVTKNTTLNIDSKFGRVEILSWEKPVVLIEVKMKAESDNRDFANETLQKLNAELSEAGNEIIIKTIIESRITTTSRKKVKFSVDYKIYAPEWINVQLLNKYGSVYIESIDGVANVDVQYGSLTIRNLGRDNDKPLNQVSLSYSKGTIEKASWLRTDLAYSKLTIEEARAIISISKYSSLTAEKLNSLVSDAKYDTYSINSLRNFAGEMRYSNLKVNELAGKLNISSSYTNVKVDKVLSGFESLTLDNSRGGYRIGISGQAAFNLFGEASRGDISVDGMSNLSRKVVNNDKTVSGTFGHGDKGDINIITKDGNVKMVIL